MNNESNDQVPTRGKRHRRRIVIGLLVALFLFWGFGGFGLIVDREMRALCAKDGGVQVFEYVSLPPNRFDNTGRPEIFSAGVDKYGPEFRYTLEETTLRNANPNTGGAALSRVSDRLSRNSDQKVLATSVSYIRQGGDGFLLVLLSLGAPSGAYCPLGPSIEKVFVKAER